MSKLSPERLDSMEHERFSCRWGVATQKLLQRLLALFPPLILVRGSTGVGKRDLVAAASAAMKEAVVYQFEPDYTIEAVRKIQTLATSETLAQGGRIFILDDFTRISAVVFNALLKTFEEPLAATTFVLIASDGYEVPATIQSRAMQVHVGTSSKDAIDEIVHASLQMHTHCAKGQISPENLETLGLLIQRMAAGAPNLARELCSSAFAHRLKCYEQMIDVGSATELFDLIESLIESSSEEISTLSLLDEWGRYIAAQWPDLMGACVQEDRGRNEKVELTKQSEAPGGATHTHACGGASLREEGQKIYKGCDSDVNAAPGSALWNDYLTFVRCLSSARETLLRGGSLDMALYGLYCQMGWLAT